MLYKIFDLVFDDGFDETVTLRIVNRNGKLFLFGEGYTDFKFL